MRIAVIIVAMSIVTTSSEASQACMSKSEARQQFPSVHIYWHGRGHCWDATPAQRHRIGRIHRKTPVREAQRKPVQPKIEQPEWRDSRSEMVADNGVGQVLRAPRDTRSDGNEEAAAGTPWALRWVDVEPSLLGAQTVGIAPVAPTVGTAPDARAVTDERKAESLITPRGVVLMCIAFVLMIGTIKFLVFALVYERRRAESDYDHWGSPAA